MTLRQELDGGKVVKQCLGEGLLINCAGNNNVLRFLPPLTIGHREIERGVTILEKVLARQ